MIIARNATLDTVKALAKQAQGGVTPQIADDLMDIMAQTEDQNVYNAAARLAKLHGLIDPFGAWIGCTA